MDAMRRTAQALAACAAIALIGVAPLETAVLNGVTNGHAYEITVTSDGDASISGGSSGAHSFSIPMQTVTRFFAVVEALRNDNLPDDGSCPQKPPPFQETVRVTWDGWTSGDVACAPNSMDPSVQRHEVQLNNTVMAIIVYAGPPASVPCYELPPEDQPPGCQR